MRAAAKLGFALVLAVVLLVTPAAACANCAKVAAASAPSAHPCCPSKPAPPPTQCHDAKCVCMDASVSAPAVAPAADTTSVLELVVFDAPLDSCPALTAAHPIPLPTVSPGRLFVAFHQFLI